MAFKYPPLLNGHSFRIFEIEAGCEDDDLRGSLESHDLDNPPTYEALSYVWGSSDRTRPMICNGKAFMITTSLNEALRRLRRPDRPLLIWIDQICINQDSIAERSQQVGVMTKIYSGAEMVNAWLGPDLHDQAPLAVDTIRKMASLFFIHVTIKTDDFPDDKVLEELGLPLRTSPAWTALSVMFSNQYFTRVWVVQEIALARQFRLIWGQSEICGYEYRWAHYWAMKNGFAVADKRSVMTSPALPLTKQTSLSIGKNTPWIELLFSGCSLEATDKRDKVFAMVGLAAESEMSIIPDYQKTYQEVCMDLALQMIQISESLDVLSFARVFDVSKARSPLWAPDLEFGDLPLPLPWVGIGYNATRDSKVRQRPTDEPGALILKGLPIGAVKIAARPLQCREVLTTLSLFEKLIEEKDAILNRYGTELLGIFVSVLIGDLNIEGNYHPRRGDLYLDRFMDYAFTGILIALERKTPTCPRTLIDLIQLAQKTRSPAADEEPYFQWAHVADGLRQDLESAHSHKQEDIAAHLDSAMDALWRMPRTHSKLTLDYSVLRSSEERRLFITKEGYVGMGPPCTEATDIVCLLFGGCTPFVLRPMSVPGEFLFIGQCHMYGMMEGEGMAMYERGELWEEWFLIR